MNLVKAQELAQSMPQQELEKYANGFAPHIIPPWLATGEMQAKMQRMQKMQAMQGAAQGPQPSVKEQIEQKAGLMGLQQAQQQMMQQQMAQPPQGGPVPEGTPEPEMQPAEETMMAGGGLAQMPVNFNFNGGGIVAFSGEDGESEVGSEDKKKLRPYPLSEQGADYEARRQAAREEESKRDGDKTSIAGDAYRGLVELAKRMASPVVEGYENLTERQKVRQEMEKNRPGLFEALSPEERAARKEKSQQLLQRLNQLVEPAPTSTAPYSVSEARATAAAGPQAAVPAGLPAAVPAAQRPPVAGPRPVAAQPAPAQAPAAPAMPNIPGLNDPAALAAVNQALKNPDQAALLSENEARLKAMGVTGRGGEEQEARIQALRDMYNQSKPSALDDLIRVFGQAGQYKGLSGTGPAYTAMQTQKRAEDLKMQEREMELRNAVDVARRTEGIAGANKVGDTLGKLRDTAATTGASVLGNQMQGNVSLSNQASQNATQLQIAKQNNLTSLEVARIHAATANRPGETERLMSQYGQLKSKDPKAAEQFMVDLERIRTGSRGATAQEKLALQRQQLVEKSEPYKNASQQYYFAKDPAKKAAAKAIMQEIERSNGIMPDLPDNIAGLVQQYAK